MTSVTTSIINMLEDILREHKNLEQRREALMGNDWGNFYLSSEPLTNHHWFIPKRTLYNNVILNEIHPSPHKVITDVKLLIFTQPSQLILASKWSEQLKLLLGNDNTIRIKDQLFTIRLNVSEINPNLIADIILFYKLPDQEVISLKKRYSKDDVDCRSVEWTDDNISTAFVIVFDHLFEKCFKTNSENPVAMIIGVAGSGKTSLLNLLDDTPREVSRSHMGVTVIPELASIDVDGKMIDFVDTPGLAEAINGKQTTNQAMSFIMNIFTKTWNRLSRILWVTTLSRYLIGDQIVADKIESILNEEKEIPVSLIFNHLDTDRQDENLFNSIKSYKQRIGHPESDHIIVFTKKEIEVDPSIQKFAEGRRLESIKSLKSMLRNIQIHEAKVDEREVNNKLNPNEKMLKEIIDDGILKKPRVFMGNDCILLRQTNDLQEVDLANGMTLVFKIINGEVRVNYLGRYVSIEEASNEDCFKHLNMSKERKLKESDIFKKPIENEIEKSVKKSRKEERRTQRGKGKNNKR